MKKIAIFIVALGMAGSQVQAMSRLFRTNTFNKVVKNVLKVGTVAYAACVSKVYATEMYNSYTNQQLPSRMQLPYSLSLNAEKQGYLQDLFKTCYTSNKPLHFNIRSAAVALSTPTKEANCVFLPDDWFQSQLNSQGNPLQSRGVIEIYIQPDGSVGMYVMDEDNEKFYAELPMEQFKQITEKYKWVIKHEVGHLELNHGQQKVTNRVYSDFARGGLGIAANIYWLKKIFSGTPTAWAIARKIPAINGVYVAGKIVDFYQARTFSRKCEREADAFANRHAESIEELENAIVRFKKHMLKDAEDERRFKEENAGIVVGLVTLGNKHFHEHPTTQERIDTINQTIQNFGKKN